MAQLFVRFVRRPDAFSTPSCARDPLATRNNVRLNFRPSVASARHTRGPAAGCRVSRTTAMEAR